MKRFKTHKELIDSGWTWHGKEYSKKGNDTIVEPMLSALGEPFDKDKGEYILPNSIDKTKWTVSPDMFTEELLLPIGTKIAYCKTKRGETNTSSKKDYLEYQGISENVIGLPSTENRRYHEVSNNYYNAQEILDAYEEYQKLNSKSKEDLLLEEARLKYPKGTKYMAVSFNSPCDIYESEGNARFVQKGVNGFKTDVNIVVSNEGNYYGAVYMDGEWAKIVSEDKSTSPIIETSKPTFKEGDWLYYDDGSMVGVFKLQISTLKNIYGAKIGFFKTGYDIIYYHENCDYYTLSTSNYVKRLATTEEVKSYLLTEANKRYPKGTNYKNIDSNGKTIDHSFCTVSSKLSCMITSKGDYQITDSCGGSVYYGSTWSEIITDVKFKPTKDDLLEQAIKNYPEGTTFICPERIGLQSNGVNIISSHTKLRWEGTDKISGEGIGYVYSKGKWAEIINVVPKSPKESYFDKKFGKKETLQETFNNSLINTQSIQTQNKQTNEKEQSKFSDSSESEINFKSFRKTATISSGTGFNQESVSGRKRRVIIERNHS
jgi:hypothetical protein